MKYDCVLFDLDGTLIQSDPGITRSARIAVEEMGYTGFDSEVFRKFIGPPLYASFREHFGMDEAQTEEAIRRYRARYSERGLLEGSLYLGIPSLLRRLRDGGARIFLATAKPAVYLDRILNHFGIAHFFEGVVGPELLIRDEDKSDIIRAALPKDAKRAVMIGDRRFDIEGGRNCGLDTIGVLYGYGSRAELEQAGATRIVDTVEELSELLAGEVPVPRGFFISVEGLDGCGKTTQIERLTEHLRERGYPVVFTREPGGSPIAEKIREVVLTPDNLGMHPWTEALLYAAARAEHVQSVVKPALAAGQVVLCDRFVDSSIAYQGGGRQLGVERVTQANAPATDGLMPDFTLYLRVDADTAMARRAGATALDRIEMEQADFHRRVFEAYEQLAHAHPERFYPVDAARSVEEISAAACAGLDAALAKL